MHNEPLAPARSPRPALTAQPITPKEASVPSLPIQASLPALNRRERAEARLIGLLIGMVLVFPMLRTGNWFAFETAQDASFSAGSRLSQIIYGLIFVTAGILALRHSRLILLAIRRTNPFLLALLAWAFITTFWSPVPVTTLKRCLQLLGVFLLASCLTLPWVQRQVLTSVLLRSVTALVLLSALVALLLPAVGVDPIRDHAWRGVTWHKNTLGAAAAFACLLWVTVIVDRSVTPKKGLVILVLLLLTLLLSRSSTALATGFVSVVTYLFMRQRFLREANLGSLVVLTTAMLLTALLLLFFTLMGRLPTWAELMSPLTMLLNRDADLTGRTEIWQLVMLEALQHPLQGLGYGAFWLNVGSASQYIIDMLGWVPLQAHSAYLDIFNELGLIGLILLIATLIWHIRALHLLGRYHPNLAAVHWAILVLILLSNVAETQIFNGVTFYNNLLFFSLVLVAHQYRLLKMAQPHLAQPHMA